MLGLAPGFAGTGALFAVKHIAARYGVFSGAHQGEFDLILNFFDVKLATRPSSRQRLHTFGGKLRDEFSGTSRQVFVLFLSG